MTETVTRQLTYEELAANYQALLTSNQELLTSNQELLSENAYLKSELAQLKRLIFGQKRERFILVANSQQLEIALAQDRPPAPPVVTTTITCTRRKTKARPIKLPSRNALPSHLRRLVATARLHQVEPFAYLSDILRRLPVQKADRLARSSHQQDR